MKFYKRLNYSEKNLESRFYYTQVGENRWPEGTQMNFLFCGVFIAVYIANLIELFS